MGLLAKEARFGRIVPIARLGTLARAHLFTGESGHMKRISMRFVAGAAVVLAAGALAFFAPALAEEPEEKKVVVKVHSGEGDGGEVRQVFVSEDGKVQVFGGDDEGDGTVHRKIFVSKDGETQVFGHGDGELHRKVFVSEDGHVQVLGSGDGDDDMHVWVSKDPEAGEHGFRFIHGSHDGPFLGVAMTDLTPELRAHFGVPEGEGVLISKVVAGSPAETAGLQVGDVLTQVDGEAVTSSSSLMGLIAGRDTGETVAVQAYRDGGVESFAATLAERPEQEVAGHMQKMVKRIKVECDGDDADCGASVIGIHDTSEFCGDGGECEIQVQCEDDGACDCLVNGESVECQALGFD